MYGAYLVTGVIRADVHGGFTATEAPMGSGYFRPATDPGARRAWRASNVRLRQPGGHLVAVRSVPEPRPWVPTSVFIFANRGRQRLLTAAMHSVRHDVASSDTGCVKRGAGRASGASMRSGMHTEDYRGRSDTFGSRPGLLTRRTGMLHRFRHVGARGLQLGWVS